jgi:hypothetical protein
MRNGDDTHRPQKPAKNNYSVRVFHPHGGTNIYYVLATTKRQEVAAAEGQSARTHSQRKTFINLYLLSSCFRSTMKRTFSYTRNVNSDSDDANDEGCNMACSVFSTSRKKPAQTDADMLLVKELNGLSLAEREQVYDEIHGVAAAIDESSPDFVCKKLEELEQELHKRSRNRAFGGYYTANFLAPQYVKNRNFRLMFLRADHFSVPAAAKRLELHFDRKLELFGVEKLCKDITWEDLSEDDKDATMSGFVQCLPSWKDRSGRRVIFDILAFHKYKNPENAVGTELQQIQGSCKCRRLLINVSFTFYRFE